MSAKLCSRSCNNLRPVKVEISGKVPWRIQNLGSKRLSSRQEKYLVHSKYTVNTCWINFVKGNHQGGQGEWSKMSLWEATLACLPSHTHSWSTFPRTVIYVVCVSSLQIKQRQGFAKRKIKYPTNTKDLSTPASAFITTQKLIFRHTLYSLHCFANISPELKPSGSSYSLRDGKSWQSMESL